MMLSVGTTSGSWFSMPMISDYLHDFAAEKERRMSQARTDPSTLPKAHVFVRRTD